jgi:hypothetical protein
MPGNLQTDHIVSLITTPTIVVSLTTTPLTFSLSLSIKDRTMDNAQNCGSYVNIPSAQTYRWH